MYPPGNPAEPERIVKMDQLNIIVGVPDLFSFIIM
jgi:hypothetical protein